MIAGHLSIADGVIISAGTGIMGSINAPGIYTGHLSDDAARANGSALPSRMRRIRILSARIKALERGAHGAKTRRRTA